MSDTERYSNFPSNPDTVLFAEDIVNCFFKVFKVPLVNSGIASHRSTIYTAFIPEVRLATQFKYNRLKEEIFTDFRNLPKKETESAVSLTNYVARLSRRTKERMVSVRSEIAECLIEFCVQVSAMAAAFFRIGFHGAPKLAVKFIIDFIDDIDMKVKDIWKAVQKFAADLLKRLAIVRRSNQPPGESCKSSDSPRLDSPNRRATDCLSSASPSKRSKRNEIEEEDQQCELPVKLTNEYVCQMCEAEAMNSVEPVPSSSTCRHVEKTVEVWTENAASSSDNASDFELSEPYTDTNYEASFEETSSEEDNPRRPKVLKKKIIPYYSSSGRSSSDWFDYE